MDQDVRLFERYFHAIRIGYEIGAQVAAIELHTFDHFQLGLQSLRLLNRDHAILADLLHGLGNDHFSGHRLGKLRQRSANHHAVLVALADNSLNCLVDAALESHRICAGSHSLHALAINRLGQNRCRRGAVTGHVRGLRSYFTNHLRAHVLERVFQFDFLGYRDTVLGDGRGAELLFDNHVAALGPKRHLHRVGERVYAAQNCLTRIFSVQNLLCHSCFSLTMCATFKGSKKAHPA